MVATGANRRVTDKRVLDIESVLQPIQEHMITGEVYRIGMDCPDNALHAHTRSIDLHEDE